MQYKITATLGPSSSSLETWRKMLSAGVTGFRLNTSHMSLNQLEEWLEKLHAFLQKDNPQIEVVLDLQGSKWRLGRFEKRELTAGQKVELRLADHSASSAYLPVPHEDFFQAAPLSSPEIMMNDAKIRMRLEAVNPEMVSALVLQGGEITSRKGITFSASDFRKEALSEKDQNIIGTTRGCPDIRYAVSYVKDGVEMEGYRSLIGDEAVLIAKLERKSALDEASLIAGHAQELWLCRGDLGSEMGMMDMAEAAYHFSQDAADFKIPVLLAGQVLEYMVEKSSPTRSEVSVIYESLQRGFAGFVLSDETAVGKYPVESCRTAALFLKKKGSKK
jgi:pyruvate kinase